MMSDVDVIMSEVVRVVNRDSRYDVSISGAYDNRRIIWCGGTIIGGVIFEYDCVVVCGSMDMYREVGRASYCDPGFFENVVRLVDKVYDA